MSKSENYLTQLINAIKNNKLFAYILLLGIIVICIGQFTSALNDIFDFINKITNKKSGELQPDTLSVSKAESGFKEKNNRLKTYDVILVLPSRMSDATILVDGKPASIVHWTPMIVTIRVIEKTTSHQITIQKGQYFCSKSLLIKQNHMKLQPCQ